MHERVRNGAVQAYRGWDGEYGPFYEEINGDLFVNYADIRRSDYVSHALSGRIRVSLTADVQSEDLINRNNALERCEGIPRLELQNACLVVFRLVADWSTFSGEHVSLQGSGFLLDFALLPVGIPDPTSDMFRVRKKVHKRVVCQVSGSGIAYKVDSGRVQLWS